MDFPFGRAAFRARRFLLCPKVLARERCGVGGNFFGRAGGDEISARFSGAGPEINHVIGTANGFLIVFDHQNGVAQVAQRLQSIEQAAVVARVQADGRLIEHVEYAAQARADLSCQPDALRFPAGKRGRGAVQREIAQTDVKKKFQALGDFGERPAGNFVLAQGELGADFIHRGARAGER